MKQRITQADIAIIPYNYLIDKDLREHLKLQVKNSIIIFDEGHNIESQCEDLFSFELNQNDLFTCYNLLKQIWEDLHR